MIQAGIEFALSEIASFEFAKEDLGDSLLTISAGAQVSFRAEVILPAVLGAEGKSQTILFGEGWAHGALSAQGAAHVDIIGSLALPAQLDSWAAGDLAAHAVSVLPASLDATGEASSVLGGQTVLLTTITGHGASNADLSSGALAQVGLNSQSAAATDFHGETSAFGDINSAGGSAVSLVGGRIFGATLYAISKSTISFVGGRGLGTVLTTKGQADAQFYASDSPEFFIRGRSTAGFYGEAHSNGELSSAPGAVVLFSGQSRHSSKLISKGLATVALRANATKHSQFVAAGKSGLNLASAVKRSGGLLSISSSVAGFRSSYVLPSVLDVGAAAHAHLEGSQVTQGDLFVFGASGSVLLTQVVTPAVFFSQGIGATRFYVGSSVYTFLPAAYDRAERQYENRGLTRPEEFRTAEFA